MNLQIRDPRAHELARRIAQRRNLSLTDAVIAALEAELRRLGDQEPLADRLGAIADDLASLSHARRPDMTKDEVDALWGHR